MKPKYYVPSMKEIEALRPNGFKVVSTFSGGGGSCTGYRMAGYKVVYANEFVPHAQSTYKLNHPDSHLDDRDIRTVDAESILERCSLGVGEIDLFDGSPPCASFSTAGRREEHWGQQKNYSGQVQRTDDLFFEYARLLKGLQPKVFVAENVSGLIKGTARGYFKIILKTLAAAGYNVKCSLLDSRWLGVPQMRQRTIFVGVRNDLKLDPVFPDPLDYQYTAGDAVETLSGKYSDEYEVYFLSPETECCKLWKITQAGKTFENACKIVNARPGFFTHVKLHPDKPANTICATNDKYHWDEPRLLSIPEIKRFQSFPDDYQLTGGFAKRWERIGRSVPPLMMKAISEKICSHILMKTI